MGVATKVWKKQKPHLIAIVGGSGAGKTWLAERLQKHLGKDAARISLDDFYRDRAHLPAGVRARINFDNPRAIDWVAFKKTLRSCAKGDFTFLPSYDFATHSRRFQRRSFKPAPIVLIDGLWLLCSPALRRFFSAAIFLDCPRNLRLKRRLTRDCSERGRDEASIRSQFLKTVSPMHERFVTPQKRWAKFVFCAPPTDSEVQRLASEIRSLMKADGISL